MESGEPHEGDETEPKPRPPHAFPIVGIGASAGGLAAFEAFFSAIPAGSNAPLAFVIVQHLAPDHKSLLTDLVRRYAKMDVAEAVDGMEVEPNHTYIIPPNRDMTLEGDKLRLHAPSEPRGQRLPIDIFFRSLARERGERAIGVVLSGTGSDGSLGVRAIKGEGGMAMAQDPTTCEHDGMPRSAIATGLVDFVLAPKEMPERIIAYTRHAFTRPTPSIEAPPDGTALKQVTGLLRAQTGHDFSSYKATTLLRRLERRMSLRQIVDLDDYLRFARDNPTEIEGLFRELLIGVTSFFRDGEAYEALEKKLLPLLFEKKSQQDVFRAWVCGCSTGEEAYSLAIALQEHVEGMTHPVKLQIFATDIDHLAIDHARAGIYPASIAADVTPERLARFFVHDPEGQTYRVQKIVREMLVFSEQDVLRDPPFSKLDLITCRNLLIYINAEVQRKLIPLFHYALNPGGGLFLGNSETIGDFQRLFSPIDRKWKIYRRESVETDPERYALADFVPPLRESKERVRARAAILPGDPVSSWRHVTEQALLAHYAEAAVLVNGRGDILYILGKTGRYLEPAAGDAALNLIAMAREGLRRELTTALHNAVARRQPSYHRAVRVKSNGGYVAVDLTLRPVELGAGARSDLYLAIFEESERLAEARDGGAAEGGSEVNDRIAELERELQTKEGYLQTMLEEMESTNEELKSTNEEMQSVNEELQSTNEELETSKEELQSVNEELSTVNAELQSKVTELSRANNDMNNLLAGTGVGTVFVDTSLRIMRFTPAATQVINLIPSDVGRPVEHIVSNLVGYPSLVDDLRAVLDTLQPREAEVVTRSGAWHLMRIRPYRTMQNTIEGAVLTFVDISERKLAEEALRLSERRLRVIFDQAFAGVAETDAAGRYTFVNDRFCEMTRYARPDLLRMAMADLAHPEDAVRARILFDGLIAGGPDYSVEMRYRCRDGHTLWVANRVSGVRDPNGRVTSAVIVSIDLTERKRLASEAAAADARLVVELDGLARLEAVGSLALMNDNRQAVFEEILDAALAINEADAGTLQLKDPDGSLRIVAERGLDVPALPFWNGAEEAGEQGQRLAGERLVVDDVTTSPVFAGTPALEAMRAAGVRSLRSLPIMTREGGFRGVLATYYRSVLEPNARQLSMFEILTRQLGDLLEREASVRGDRSVE